MPPPLSASPFTGTATYYARFRAPYSQEAIDFILESCGAGTKVHALDLGCGPGTLAIPLSWIVAQVTAVDPDADMVAEGQRLAASQGRGNIQWLQSRAEDISLPAASFRVATIGQAFHWMDRDEVLRKLANLIEEGGRLALVNPGRRRPQESWEPLAEQVIARFLGFRGRHMDSNPHEPEHEPALLRSEYFSTFATREFPGRMTRDIASILGCIYSKSSSAKPLFAEDAPAFESELTKSLRVLSPSGVFEERIETEVLLAPKKAR